MGTSELCVLVSRKLVTVVHLLMEVLVLGRHLVGSVLLRPDHLLVPDHQIFVGLDGSFVPVEGVFEVPQLELGQHPLRELSDRLLVFATPALQLPVPPRMLFACCEVLGVIVSMHLRSSLLA